MKLTRLYIHNYKSFYDTTIEIGKLNIVVGENNSGKSNLIDVLEFIDIAMNKDIERAISDKGGYNNIKNYSAISEKKVIIRATFEVDNNLIKCFIVHENDKTHKSFTQGKGNYTFSFSFSERYSLFSICINMNFKHERYDVKLHENFTDKTLETFNKINSYKTIYLICSDKKYFDRSSKTRSKVFIFSKESSEYINDYLLPILNHIGISNKYDEYKISTYYFHANTIRNSAHKDSRDNNLLKDGSNLGKTLFEIKNKDKNNFENISNSLITTVNEIDGIEIYKLAGNYIIGFKERKKEPISIDTISDGTINFLATVTALNQNSHHFLLAFEEPERHLHLKVMDYLLKSFRESNKQIIVTTHSTELLNYAELDEVVFIYRDNEGDTQSISAIDIPNLKGKMERLSYKRPMNLDEMIACGMVGNFE